MELKKIQEILISIQKTKCPDKEVIDHLKMKLSQRRGRQLQLTDMTQQYISRCIGDREDGDLQKFEFTKCSVLYDFTSILFKFNNNPSKFRDELKKVNIKLENYKSLEMPSKEEMFHELSHQR